MTWKKTKNDEKKDVLLLDKIGLCKRTLSLIKFMKLTIKKLINRNKHIILYSNCRVKLLLSFLKKKNK